MYFIGKIYAKDNSFKEAIDYIYLKTPVVPFENYEDAENAAIEASCVNAIGLNYGVQEHISVCEYNAERKEFCWSK